MSLNNCSFFSVKCVLIHTKVIKFSHKTLFLKDFLAFTEHFFLIVVTPPYYIKEIYSECFKCVVFLCDWVCDCWSVAQIDGDPSIFELAFVNTDCWNLHTCESFEFEL